MKKILLAILVMFTLTACSAEKTNVSVAVMTGPTGMGMAQLMEMDETGEASNEYEFTVTGTSDEIVASLIKGELDIAAVPANLAAVLYTKTEGEVTVLAINTLNVLNVLETGEEIQSIADLAGKTVYSTGKGTTPEYVLTYLLSQAGLDINEDLTVEYKSEAAEVLAVISEEEDAIAILPQPYATAALKQNDSLRIALDLGDVWDANNTDSSIVTGVIVARTAFVEENEAAVEAFLAEYKESIEYTSDAEAASVYIGKFGIFDESVSKLALPYCNIAYIDGDEMATKLSGYLEVLYDQDPSSVGGNLPGEEFYY